LLTGQCLGLLVSEQIRHRNRIRGAAARHGHPAAANIAALGGLGAFLTLTGNKGMSTSFGCDTIQADAGIGVVTPPTPPVS
jgi:hypothetical protein